MIDSRVRLNLDLRETGRHQTVEAKRGDTGRVLMISLSDGGTPYLISEDCRGVFTAKKRDGTVLYDPCTVQNNVLLYAFTEQTCAAVGAMPAEIRLYGGDGKLLISAGFTLEVRDTVWNEGDLVSRDQMNALDALVLETMALKEQVEQKLESGAFQGDDYVLTDADRLEIAEMAAQLVGFPEGGAGSGVNAGFRVDETLILEKGILRVNTTSDLEQDNTLPITSAGVYAAVGNIEALLKTI